MLRVVVLLSVFLLAESIKNFRYDCPNPFGTGTVTQSDPCDRVLGCTECQTSDFCRKINGPDQMCSVNGCCVDDPQKGSSNCTRECHSHAHCEQEEKEGECFEGCCRKKPSRGASNGAKWSGVGNILGTCTRRIAKKKQLPRRSMGSL
ncbi:hypothetical protein PENTCL1PPCAC_10505 [Pristionchus entomophagus]|uniref:Uncharacterized protein n=1 Tax=Pristionchus entomophagus TaxID=358040 RepID=A0AAV5SZY4_9BILA|nr:hypothetical protein PENTCL1PPCAC_10505 [Pristionchus entomophagus]